MKTEQSENRKTPEQPTYTVAQVAEFVIKGYIPSCLLRHQWSIYGDGACGDRESMTELVRMMKQWRMNYWRSMFIVWPLFIGVAVYRLFGQEGDVKLTTAEVMMWIILVILFALGTKAFYHAFVTWANAQPVVTYIPNIHVRLHDISAFLAAFNLMPSGEFGLLQEQSVRAIINEKLVDLMTEAICFRKVFSEEVANVDFTDSERGRSFIVYERVKKEANRLIDLVLPLLTFDHNKKWNDAEEVAGNMYLDFKIKLNRDRTILWAD